MGLVNSDTAEQIPSATLATLKGTTGIGGGKKKNQKNPDRGHAHRSRRMVPVL
jgi:hypothetical protein